MHQIDIYSIFCQYTEQTFARFDYKLHVMHQRQTNIVHEKLMQCVYVQIQQLVTHFA